MKARRDLRERLVAILGDPPDVRKYDRVPEGIWKEAEQNERLALIPILVSVAKVSAERVSEKVGFSVDASVIAQRYAERQAKALAREAVKNTRAAIRDLSRAARKQIAALAKAGGDADAGDAAVITLDELGGRFDSLFGRDRAENTGITETTAADTGGGAGVVDRARRDGRTVDLLWVTERDSKVCPICRPLHGEAESVWSRSHPNGPPAHPRCRCELRYVSGQRQGQSPETPNI